MQCMSGWMQKTLGFGTSSALNVLLRTFYLFLQLESKTSVVLFQKMTISIIYLFFKT